jgi:hypothetical protein
MPIPQVKVIVSNFELVAVDKPVGLLAGDLFQISDFVFEAPRQHTMGTVGFKDAVLQNDVWRRVLVY